MNIEASSDPRATLIGDVVGSRTVPDRAAAHRLVNDALRDVADDAVDPPAFTVGDEFQGAFTSVGLAIDAALSLRLAVAPGIDVRFGDLGHVRPPDDQYLALADRAGRIASGRAR